MAHHERLTMPAGEILPGLGSWRNEDSAPPDPWTGMAQFADMFARTSEVVQAMANFSREVARIYGPPARIMIRYMILHNHRRHQDERRCYAKQARREHTGWRQW